MAARTPQATEAEVQSACLDYLEMKRYFFFRLNNIPAHDRDGNMRRLPKYTPKGLPDAVVVKKGQFIGLEFKSTKGKLSPEQLRIAQRILSAEGDYHIVRSIDDLMKIGL